MKWLFFYSYMSLLDLKNGFNFVHLHGGCT